MSECVFLTSCCSPKTPPKCEIFHTIYHTQTEPSAHTQLQLTLDLHESLPRQTWSQIRLD